MLKKLTSILGVTTTIAIASNAPYYEPYKKESLNYIYNLLFCDSVELFKKENIKEKNSPWREIFADKFNAKELQALVDSNTTESRVKILAYNKMRDNKIEVPSKKLYGVIVEVNMPQGLDVLASFADGSARYINYSEKIAVVDGVPNIFEKHIQAVLDASQNIVDKIGVWDKERLAPPAVGNMRFTFLCSDGLYFGEGSMEAIQSDALSQPLFMSAVGLLRELTDKVK